MAGLDTQLLSDALASSVEKNAPSLVRVEARMRGGATGIVWDGDGMVVTASHVIERDENLGIGLPDGSSRAATLVGRDPATDVAVLKVEGAAGLQPASWRDLEGVKVGHLALTIARPGRTVRAVLGIFGAIGGDEFHTPSGGRIERYVQTDSTPRHGFSGGVVSLADGSLVGMNTSGLARDSNVVIPAETLRRVVGELITHGHPRRGYLGVGIYPLRLPSAVQSQIGHRLGAIVLSVEPGSPADRAGVLQGDVLVTLDDETIARPVDLTAVLESRIDKAVTLRVVRAGALRELTITPVARD